MAFLTKKTDSAIEFTLKVQGSINTDGYNVAAFHIDRTINKIPYADISILDGNVAEQTFEQSDGFDFVPGKIITLLAGDPKLQNEIFKGVIITQKIKQNEHGTILELKVKDVAVRMTVGRKNKYFYNKKDGEILKDILTTYAGKGITFDVQASSEQAHSEMVQYYCTDWDFIVSRAEASNRVVMVEDGEVIIKTPEVIPSPDNFPLTFGDNTYDFEAEIDGRNEYKEVVAKSWDSIEGKLVTPETVVKTSTFITEGNIKPNTLATDVIDLNQFLLQHGGSLKIDELQLWAESKMLRSRLAMVRGRARVEGTSDLKLGGNVNIIKFSGRFNGPAFISGIRHEMSGNSTWFTDVQFGYSQEWFAEKYNDIIDRPAAGLLPAVNGLMIGVVTAITSADDPDCNHRVRVRMPMVNNESDGVWARVSTLDAGDLKGKKHGVFFRPEIGDEVILGFLDDDPRQPIILGSLFSANKAEPEVTIDGDEKNFQKGIFTKSGLKLVFDDDKETILISTKDDATSILITEKDKPSIILTDKNKNSIEMSDKGILITSCKDIIFKADKGDIKSDGLNIEIAAKAQFKAEGTSGAEINSSGSTVVKGTIVQIN